MNHIAHRYRTVGFTLAELVIVFAIVAILSAVLFAVFQRVRKNGQRTTCLNNMKQISLGLQQYVQDNDSRFPAAGLPDEVLLPYVKDKKLFRCPSIPQEELPYLHYVIPGWLQKTDWNARKIVNGCHEADIPTASEIVSLAEMIGRDEPHETISSSCTLPQEVGVRHFNGNNYAFVDGHVEWIREQQFIDDFCKNSARYPKFYDDDD